MIRRLRVHLSRMLAPYLYTPEGFRRSDRQYVVPQDTIILPAGEKRTITVCNLFSNHHKSIAEIAEVLDTNRRAVVSMLILEGLISDRRNSKRGRKFERRQTVKYHLPKAFPTGQTDEFRALCGQTVQKQSANLSSTGCSEEKNVAKTVGRDLNLRNFEQDFSERETWALK